MSEEKIFLKLDDEIASYKRGSFSGSVYKITRIAKSMAFCERDGENGSTTILKKFKLEISNYGSVTQIGAGSDPWSNISYRLITDEIRKEIIEKQEATKLSILLTNAQPQLFSTEERKLLIQILSKYKK